MRQQWIRCGAAAAIAGMLAACSSAPTVGQLAADAVEAMGGSEQLAAIETVAMLDGAGIRMRLGQQLNPGAPDEPAELTAVTETLDRAGRRAALDYQLQTASGFSQHRQEILTRMGDGPDAPALGVERVAGRPDVAMSVAGLFSWGSQNSPEFLLRRNVLDIVTAAAAAGGTAAAVDREFNGRPHRYGVARMPWGEDAGLYFDPESGLLAGFEFTDTETMLGDVPAQYALGDYRDVDGVMLPHRMTIRKAGQDYADVQFAAIAINAPEAGGIFAIPESVAAQARDAVADAAYTPVRLDRVAAGVYHAAAYSHHSLVVEFPEWIVVVEAPYTEAQSMMLAKRIEEQFPGKPIRYAAVSHHHYDHVGGVRGMAAHAATILVERAHAPAVNALLDAPHSNPSDQLQRRRDESTGLVGSVEIFEGMAVIEEGGQRLELHAITGSPHADTMVIAYVPGARILFQSDLFFPGTGGASPAAAHLLESVRALNLRVDTNVGGHGGVGPFSELVNAVGAMN